MQKQTTQLVSLKPMPLKSRIEPAPASSGQDVLGQFKANLAQVTELQKRLNFMVREVSGLVKPRKA
ncbi:MAG: hypothetical protein R2827_12455 [Bdellovibrionales bacterium]